MNELTVNQTGIARTQEVIGAEIRSLTASARTMTMWYYCEIGKRLTEAKELVPHGEWMDFLARETEFSSSSAGRLMQVYKEYGTAENTNFPTLGNISISNALRLLAVPEEEREAFAAEVDAEHLTTRELEDAIKAREAAERELAQADEAIGNITERLNEAKTALEEERDATEGALLKLQEAEIERDAFREKLQKQAEKNKELQKQVRELESRPVEVAVQEPRQEDVDKAVAEAMAETEKAHATEIEELKRNKQAEVQRADKLAEEKKKLAEQLAEVREKLKSADAGNAGEKAALTAEVERLKKQISMGGAEVQAFKMRFEDWQKAYNTMQTALDMLAPEQREKCEAAVKAVIAGWTK